MSVITKLSVKEAVKKYAANFKSELDINNPTATFIDLLWRIIEDEKYAGKEVCFTPIVLSGKNEIVVASAEGGYWPSQVYFQSSYYHECALICDDLNADVFGLTKKEASIISLKSVATPFK